MRLTKREVDGVIADLARETMHFDDRLPGFGLAGKLKPEEQG